MQSFPHRYQVVASSLPEDNVEIQSESLSDIVTAAPAEFGGPGYLWSPETLLTASVADCFILSFKAISKASKFDWLSLSCEVEGVLDRVERATQFTEFTVKAILKISDEASRDKAEKLLEKAEANCLISNSLKAKSHLQIEIRTK